MSKPNLPPMPNELWATLDAEQEDQVYAYAEEAVRQALAAQRNDGFASLSLWWTMIEAEAELVGETVADDAPILHFMGSGASHQVTAGEIRAALASRQET